MVSEGQRIEITAYKFTALPEESNDEFIESSVDPCKHILIFMDGTERHEVKCYEYKY